MIQIEKITEWAIKQTQTAGISIKQHPLLIGAFFIIFAPVGGLLASWFFSHDIATAYKDRDLYKDCLDQGLSCKQIRDLKTVTVYKTDPAQTAELNALREALDKIKCAPSTPSTETPRPTQNKIGVDDQSLWPNIIIDNAYAQDTVDENGKGLLLAAANVHNDSNTNASVERQFTIATLTKPTSKLEYYIPIYKKMMAS